MRSMSATVREVAERTRQVPVTVWGFGVGGALSGLVRAGWRLGRPDYAEAVTTLVTPSLSAPPGPTDHLISVETLVALARARPGLVVDDACARWVGAVLHAPRPVSGGPRVHRPDLASWSSTIWVDCMHTDGPGLAALGMRDEAVAYAAEYAAVLQRDDGLVQHGYDVEAGRGNGVAWGRGQGWALLGLAETLRAVAHDGLVARLRRLVEALAAHEDAGRWHTVVDDPASPIENSVAAYVAYGLGRAVSSGLVAAEHAAMATRAYESTLAALASGALAVSQATPVGDRASYHAPVSGVFPWGQGPVLHALLDRMEPRETPGRPPGETP